MFGSSCEVLQDFEKERLSNGKTRAVRSRSSELSINPDINFSLQTLKPTSSAVACRFAFFKAFLLDKNFSSITVESLWKPTMRSPHLKLIFCWACTGSRARLLRLSEHASKELYQELPLCEIRENTSHFRAAKPSSKNFRRVATSAAANLMLRRVDLSVLKLFFS